jgi:hypothetical protein
MLLTFSLNLIYLLLAAPLVVLVGKILKQDWSYGTSYRLALHATTLPLIVSSVFSMVGLSHTGIPFLPFVLLLLVVYTNFKSHEAITPAKEEVKTPTA